MDWQQIIPVAGVAIFALVVLGLILNRRHNWNWPNTRRGTADHCQHRQAANGAEPHHERDSRTASFGQPGRL